MITGRAPGVPKVVVVVVCKEVKACGTAWWLEAQIGSLVVRAPDRQCGLLATRLHRNVRPTHLPLTQYLRSDACRYQLSFRDSHTAFCYTLTAAVAVSRQISSIRQSTAFHPHIVDLVERWRLNTIVLIPVYDKQPCAAIFYHLPKQCILDLHLVKCSERDSRLFATGSRVSATSGWR